MSQGLKVFHVIKYPRLLGTVQYLWQYGTGELDTGRVVIFDLRAHGTIAFLKQGHTGPLLIYDQLWYWYYTNTEEVMYGRVFSFPWIRGHAVISKWNHMGLWQFLVLEKYIPVPYSLRSVSSRDIQYPNFSTFGFLSCLQINDTLALARSSPPATFSTRDFFLILFAILSTSAPLTSMALRLLNLHFLATSTLMVKNLAGT